MKSAVVASVAVERTAFHFDKPYDYLIPFDMEEGAVAGCRVVVPFGGGNRKRQGIILSVGVSSDLDKIKPICSVIDKLPVFTAEMISLATWIKEQTSCTYFDAFKLMLPAGISMRITTEYKAADIDAELPDDLDPDQFRMVKYLQQSRASVERSRLLDIMGLNKDSDMPEKLCKMGLLIRSDETVRRMNDATVKMVRIADGFDPGKKLTDKQRSVIELLETAGSAAVKELCYFTGVTSPVVTRMISNGILESYENEVYRKPDYDRSVTKNNSISLTKEQNKAYEDIKSLENSGGTALLYGVTGSGKTQVFLKMVDHVIKNKRGVIVMVPEIALTPQTLGIFYSRYGDKVAVFHSAMSLGQRMDEWKRVKNGDAVIAVGTRSAVFAPFDDIGLIIMDEEQEHTYKSESSPRYHARDIARYRCAYNKGVLILSSATPSVETFTLAKKGKYKLCELKNRYGTAKLPEVRTVDMREEMAAGNTSIFSRELIEQIKIRLDDKKQSILLLNRRGYNTFVSCAGCGEVMTCPNCSISLTYHSANNRLMCHYCGYSEPFRSECAKCGNTHIKYSGVGTQRAEQELSAILPNARILRMDADSIMSRSAYKDKLGAFAAGDYDIMIGTQMVAKGLDFPNVTLVGVLNADGALYSDDYRSYERTFSLLTQVVGRSGRGEYPGTALIQTVTPDNNIIKLAARQDYDGFYAQEIMTRRLMVYPPYCDICMIGFVGEDYEFVKNSAADFFDRIKRYNSTEFSDVKMIILGPSPASVPKVGGKYRCRMIIKTKNSKRLRELIGIVLREYGKDSSNKNVTAYVDMNPDTIL